MKKDIIIFLKVFYPRKLTHLTLFGIFKGCIMTFDLQRIILMKNLLKKIFCLNSFIIFLTFLLIGANSFYLLASIMVNLHSDIKILEPGTEESCKVINVGTSPYPPLASSSAMDSRSLRAFFGL